MRKRAFTLVEIMVVVVIIGLLASLVGPRIFSGATAGMREAALAKCSVYHGAVQIWMIQRRLSRVPASLGELEQPLNPGDETNYLRVDPDPWGNPFRLVAEGRRKFRVWSDGQDGEQGTVDDICYEPLDED